MKLIRIDGDFAYVYHNGYWMSVGCNGLCPRCFGGWPGTLMTGKALVQAAMRGILDPDRLGCQVTKDQAKIISV